ncbi:MAG TPA: hypothetical protein VK956_16265 [Verrucomicrobium sp.]|nr:hypothetical protein [Verrucomicrobium sp.]
MADSWGLMAACMLLFCFFSFAVWALRKDVARLMDDPPLKSATLDQYLRRSPANETESAVITKLVRDYELMESRYQTADKVPVSLLFSAAIAAAAGAVICLIAILTRGWRSPPEDRFEVQIRRRAAFLLAEKVKAVKVLDRPPNRPEQAGPRSK